MDSIQEGLFALDANGNITYVNEKCERTLQLSRESLLGRNIRDVLSNDHNNLDFINKVVSGRRVTDENVTLIIGSEVVQFNVTCSRKQF
jgi:PAS domain S-box-containing protein